MRWQPLLLVPLLLASPGSAGAVDLDDNQILIEATLVSISKHEEMELDLGPFGSGERIDAATEALLESAAAQAAAQTQSVIAAIAADTALAASPIGSSALGHLFMARLEEGVLQGLLAEAGEPKAKEVLTPVIAGKGFQVAALNALQTRPDRFPDPKRVVQEATEFWSAYDGVLPFLQSHGLPTDRSALFEPFSAGKGKALAERIGLEPGPDARIRFRNGKAELSAPSKTPVTAGADFTFRLPGDYTVLATFSLPTKGKAKPRPELAGFSAGLKVTTDTSSNPAEAFFIEHQTTPDGWIQSFVSSKTAVLEVFPPGAASQTRKITSFLTKDDDTLVLGGVLQDEAGETLIQRSVPVVGDLPVLGLFFRNGTKKAAFQVDDLVVFVTPHLVSEP